jgi:hypothetical protein
LVLAQEFLDNKNIQLLALTHGLRQRVLLVFLLFVWVLVVIKHQDLPLVRVAVVVHWHMQTTLP